MNDTPGEVPALQRTLQITMGIWNIRRPEEQMGLFSLHNVQTELFQIFVSMYVCAWGKKITSIHQPAEEYW